MWRRPGMRERRCFGRYGCFAYSTSAWRSCRRSQAFHCHGTPVVRDLAEQRVLDLIEVHRPWRDDGIHVSDIPAVPATNRAEDFAGLRRERNLSERGLEGALRQGAQQAAIRGGDRVLRDPRATVAKFAPAVSCRRMRTASDWRRQRSCAASAARGLSSGPAATGRPTRSSVVASGTLAVTRANRRRAAIGARISSSTSLRVTPAAAKVENASSSPPQLSLDHRRQLASCSPAPDGDSPWTQRRRPAPARPRRTWRHRGRTRPGRSPEPAARHP